MPNITAPITLFDGLATPVTRSFVPYRVAPELATFYYKVNVMRSAWIGLDVKWSDSSAKRPTTRQEISLDYPLVRNVAGVDTIVANGRAIVTFVIPDQMTDQEIKDLRAFTQGSLGNAAITAGTVNREPLYG